MKSVGWARGYIEYRVCCDWLLWRGADRHSKPFDMKDLTVQIVSKNGTTPFGRAVRNLTRRSTVGEGNVNFIFDEQILFR